MSQISKQHRRLIAILSMSEGFALMIRDHYRERKRNKTMLALLSRLETKVQAAAEEWRFTGQIHARDYDRVQGLLRRYEVKALPKEGSPTILLAVHLALYDDTIREMKQCKAPERRIVMLEEIEAATLRLYKYWDKDFSHVKEADMALNAVRIFEQEAEAA